MQYSDSDRHWGGLSLAANWLQTAPDSVVPAPLRTQVIVYWTHCSITREILTCWRFSREWLIDQSLRHHWQDDFFPPEYSSGVHAPRLVSISVHCLQCWERFMQPCCTRGPFSPQKVSLFRLLWRKFLQELIDVASTSICENCSSS